MQNDSFENFPARLNREPCGLTARHNFRCIISQFGFLGNWLAVLSDRPIALRAFSPHAARWLPLDNQAWSGVRFLHGPSTFTTPPTVGIPWTGPAFAA